MPVHSGNPLGAKAGLRWVGLLSKYDKYFKI
jgi:hypothetical protein